METYCVSCKKYTASENSSVRKISCSKKKLTFIKSQDLDNISNYLFKMKKVINKFLLTGFKFIPELHLKQPGFTYSACGPFTKHCERIQKFRETDNLKHLYRNESGKACFAHDATYSDSKDLVKTTISDNILKDRAYEIAGNRNYHGYQRALANMIYKCF